MKGAAIATIVAAPDGPVVSVSGAARELVGEPAGRACWDYMNAMVGAKDLPCRNGCVGELLRAGIDTAREVAFTINGHHHSLSCVPVDGQVVCVISRSGCQLPGLWVRLTDRERQILQHVADGETTGVIASNLGIAESTVRAHVQHMRDRLGTPTRAALVARAMRLALID